MGPLSRRQQCACLGLREGLLDAHGWPPDMRLWLRWASPGLAPSKVADSQLLPQVKTEPCLPRGTEESPFCNCPCPPPPKSVCPPVTLMLSGCSGSHVDGLSNLGVNFPARCPTLWNIGAGVPLSMSSQLFWWGGSVSLPAGHLSPTTCPWLCSRGSPGAQSHPVERAH